MKISEVKELTTKELQEKVEAAKAKLQQLKMTHSITPLDNPSQLKAIRTDIARMLTVLRQRELNI